MPALPPNFYAEWRERSPGRAALRDRAAADSPPERLLQQIWLHQRLLRDELRTLDGQPLRIVHPGFWNREPGPDFRGAVVQFASDPAKVGDIEIDLHPSGWRGHGHETNAAYKNVILRVLWQPAALAADAPKIPVLALKQFLDSPLAELDRWLGGEPIAAPASVHGKCASPLRDLPGDTLLELLNQAALIRFCRKAAQIEARARQSGWEQALWEELFGALGYKHNTWPMRRVAELSPLNGASKLAPAALEARLLGLGNLLPAEVSTAKSAADRHTRLLWDHWWRESDGLERLPKAAWRFAGLRPANHPARRLALAAHWGSDGTLAQRLEQWLLRNISADDLEQTLNDALAAPEHPFWGRHLTFNSKAAPRPQPLLGASRATDLAINVILPWLWIRAEVGRNEKLRNQAQRRYLAWPPAQDNSVLRLARQRLLGGRWKPATAAQQQGLIQIVRDFCDHSNAACEQCRFPEMVRAVTAIAPSASAA